MLNSFAPSFRLVGAYFLFGISHLLLSIFGFLFFDDSIDSFSVVGFIHTFLLGFVVNIIIGALYQLTSVILEKPFFSIKGAFANCFIQNISILFLIYSFYTQNTTLLLYSGAFCIVSLIYFDVLFLLTFTSNFKKTIASISLIIGGLFLLVGLVFAFLLIGFFANIWVIEYELFFRLHIYFAFGFVFFISVGAASVLVPMFALVHDGSDFLNKLGIVLYLISSVLVGVWGVFYLAIISILCFIAQIVKTIYLRRIKDFYTFNIYLAGFSMILSLYHIITHSYLQAIFILLYGTLMPFVLAHIYKILPFLIWYHYISKFVGNKKVPLLSDMVIKPIAYLCLFFNLILIICIFAKLYTIGLVCMIICFMLVMINIFNFFKYTRSENEK